MRFVRAAVGIPLVSALSCGIAAGAPPAWASDKGTIAKVTATSSAGKSGGDKGAGAKDSSGKRGSDKTEDEGSKDDNTSKDKRENRQYKCVLELGADRGAKTSGEHDGDADDRSGPKPPKLPPGNVVVEIPPVAIARAHGNQLVVTTNTGRAPDQLDSIYYFSNGKGSLAPERIRQEVLSGCTTRRHR